LGVDAVRCQNGAALQTLLSEPQVQMIQFPDAVFNTLRKLADEVLEEEAAKSDRAKKSMPRSRNFRKW